MEKKPVKYILLGLLAAFLIKSLVLPTGLNEVLTIGILASLAAFVEMKINSKKHIELQNQINELIAQNKIQDKNIDDLKGSITSVKMASGVRGITR